MNPKPKPKLYVFRLHKPKATAGKVTPDSQVLHFKRYNTWWGINGKKVKASMRSRLRWNDEAWNRAVDQACLVTWCVNESRHVSDATLVVNIIILWFRV